MKCHSAALFIFLQVVAQFTASRVGHHQLTASGDAEIDAMDAVAIRRLATHDQQRASADSAHLRGLADKEAKNAANHELEVQEELQDAQAIDTVVRLDANHSSQTTDETEDAQQLRKVAVIEEEEVVNDEKDAKKLRADADAIAAAGGKRDEEEIADAKALEGFATSEVAHANSTKNAKDSKTSKQATSKDAKTQNNTNPQLTKAKPSKSAKQPKSKNAKAAQNSKPRQTKAVTKPVKKAAVAK